ncbi:hypothetical protein HAX54_048693 [Datura stramonium]|uniref:Protein DETOXIFICATION n=1 Tax=Datura stramonium TaxID=4076 RepID=A0ABS8SU08_DATST|nr:hypothetical protein [Datura stramonium]
MTSYHQHYTSEKRAAPATNGWWNKLQIDLDGATKQSPLFVMSSIFYSINLVSVMFAGHFGKLQLAASNLANSWAVLTGFSFMFGLSAALETLCRQVHGPRMLGIRLHTSCIISFFFSTAIALLWWYSDTILINLFHQDHDIAKEARVLLKFLILGLFAYGVLQNVLTFLQAQLMLVSLLLYSLAALVIHIAIIASALVRWRGLGYKGASLATSISIWISLLMFSLHLFFSNRSNHMISWDYGCFSFEPFHHILRNLKLALPSAAMVCLAYCAFEILVLLAGLMPNLETTTSIIAMSVNTQAIPHMLSSGLSVAAIDSVEIINKFSSMIPLLLISILLDFSQGILSGVARGCGWQRCAMYINFTAFYFIGMPIAGLVAFKFNLHAQPPSRLPKELGLDKIRASVLMPHLQNLFQQTSIQQDLSMNLLSSLQLAEAGDGSQHGKSSP